MVSPGESDVGLQGAYLQTNEILNAIKLNKGGKGADGNETEQETVLLESKPEIKLTMMDP